MRVGLAVLLLALVAACGGDEDSNTTLACRTLREVATDYSDGVTTIDELPDALERLVRDARGSDELHPLATEALDQARAGDVAGLAETVRAMDGICG